jgi:RHS repeat-associated protein
MMLSGRNGQAVASYSYDAFGVVYDDHPSVGRPQPTVPEVARPAVERGTEYLYTGKRLDPDTGHVDYGFRDYAPRLARFTTVDPIKDGNNWYAYVNNDPVNYIDPSGLIPIEAADLQNRPFGGSNENSQQQYFDTETRSLRIKTADPFEADAFEKYNDFMKDHGSITVRGGGGGGGSYTRSASGAKIGAGPVIGAGLSITFDLTFTIPIPNESKLDYSAGVSANVPLFLGAIAGIDLSWSENGLSVTSSFGVGVGTAEGHFIVSDDTTITDSRSAKGR